ncbi:MAG: hypothetical protein V4489_05430 [Chlamydiota bacterium]
MTFSKLLGNEQAKSLLTKLALKERDSHILLFSGTQDVGKKSFAIAFLSLLLGEKHAKKIQGNIHPDVIWLKPEGKLHLHTVASIKQMIDEAPLYPFEAKKKIYIIEEADRMLPPSSNALLKMLEEPPAHICFILLTSHEEAILPTLLSRCSRIPFYPIGEDLIASALEEKGTPSEKIKEIAMISKGSLSLALHLLTEEKNPIQLHFIEILRHFFLERPSLSLTDALDHLEKLIDEQAEKEGVTSQIAEKLLDDFLFWIRDLHYRKTDPQGKDLFYKKHSLDLDRQLQNKIPSLETGLLLIDKARLALQRSIKPKVIFEHLFMQVANSSW